MKATKVRIGSMLAAVLVAGGTLAGAVAMQDGGQGIDDARAVDSAVAQDAGEPIVYAGSFGLYPSK